jgi:hypothetical protein
MAPSTMPAIAGTGAISVRNEQQQHTGCSAASETHLQQPSHLTEHLRTQLGILKHNGLAQGMDT